MHAPCRSIVIAVLASACAGHGTAPGTPPAAPVQYPSTYVRPPAGKAANVVVWSGDPFEFASRAEHVFIRGVDVPLGNRQTELRERYRKLPPAR
jgi:hypothetical protein